MRQQPLRFFVLIRLAACISASLALSTCTLWPPSCGNRDVKAAIEKDASEVIESWIATTALKDARLQRSPVRLISPVKTAERGDSRSCSATIKIGEAEDGFEVPVDYEVLQAEDGNAKYRWDEANFGKTFFANAMLKAIAKERQSSESTAEPAGTAGEKTEAPDEATATWKAEVHALLQQRLQQLPEMPHGSQRVNFRVGPDGEITEVTTVGEVHDPDMAKAAVRALESMDHVPKPPTGEISWLTVTLRSD